MLWIYCTAPHEKPPTNPKIRSSIRGSQSRESKQKCASYCCLSFCWFCICLKHRDLFIQSNVFVLPCILSLLGELVSSGHKCFMASRSAPDLSSALKCKCHLWGWRISCDPSVFFWTSMDNFLFFQFFLFNKPNPEIPINSILWVFRAWNKAKHG